MCLRQAPDQFNLHFNHNWDAHDTTHADSVSTRWAVKQFGMNNGVWNRYDMQMWMCVCVCVFSQFRPFKLDLRFQLEIPQKNAAF